MARLALAETAGELVPLGRGGERRAIALANPGLGGRPFATPTLWAAIQYLRPAEDAPVHRHSQNAFRFVIEGAGVWTVVNGDGQRRPEQVLGQALQPAVDRVDYREVISIRWPAPSGGSRRASATAPRARSRSSPT
jgi:hypothetical protein